MYQNAKLSLSSLIVLLLTACGDSSSDSGSALMTLNITDAPVDDAEAVVVQFTSVELKASGEDDSFFEFDDPKTIDLLQLQGSNSQALLENVEIPAGDYTQIRLGVNAELDEVMDSYIDIDEGGPEPVRYELYIPSGAQTGLKLNTPFTIAEGSEGIEVADDDAIYTIDFDLRKSVTDPQGSAGYKLRPSLRLIQNIETGSIAGTVDVNLLDGVGGETCSDVSELTTGNAVYLFEGANIVPDDIDDMDAEPLTTALVDYNSDNDTYNYEFGYIAEGDYTIALTCSADLETEADDAGVEFTVSENITVVADEETEHPFD